MLKNARKNAIFFYNSNTILHICLWYPLYRQFFAFYTCAAAGIQTHITNTFKSELLIVLSLILIRCGDIELNPGPELDSDSSSSTASAFSDLELKINSQLYTTMSKVYLIKLILFSQNCSNLM